LTIRVRKLADYQGQERRIMLITKRNQYALKAIFELAKHSGEGPRKISDIAQAQAIPVKFLEVILNQLKGSGLVESKRGFYGGYFLARQPNKLRWAILCGLWSAIRNLANVLPFCLRSTVRLKANVPFIPCGIK